MLEKLAGRSAWASYGGFLDSRSLWQRKVFLSSYPWKKRANIITNDDSSLAWHASALWSIPHGLTLLLNVTVGGLAHTHTAFVPRNRWSNNSIVETAAGRWLGLYVGKDSWDGDICSTWLKETNPNLWSSPVESSSAFDRSDAVLTESIKLAFFAH